MPLPYTYAPATSSYTQSQLSERLGLKRQNVHHCIKELEEHGYILVDRVEGRNKFLKTNMLVSSICATLVNEQAKGQLEFDNTSE